MNAGRLSVVLIVVALCFVESLHSQQQNNVAPLPEWLVFSRKTKVDVQILEPTGIQFWIKYKPKYLTFGVELYVNPTTNDQFCDLCRNVSDPIDGKFLIEDTNLRVKLGDTIKYRAVKVKANQVKWSPWKTVFVDKHLYSQSKNHCAVQCGYTEGYEKIQFLEGYLQNILDYCITGPPSEHLFFPMNHAAALVNDADRFVKSRLYSVELLRPLIGRVENSYVSQDGVGFKMSTVVDKLKVLHLGRDQLGVVDYDEYIIVPSASAPVEHP